MLFAEPIDTMQNVGSKIRNFTVVAYVAHCMLPECSMLIMISLHMNPQYPFKIMNLSLNPAQVPISTMIME